MKNGVERTDERAAVVRVAAVELHADLADIGGGESETIACTSVRSRRELDPVHVDQ